MGSQGPLLANLASLPLGEPSPYPELLGVHDGELQTVNPHLADSADRFGLASGRPTLGEEKVGVGTAAVGVVLPTQVIDGQRLDQLPMHEILLVAHASLVTQSHCSAN